MNAFRQILDFIGGAALALAAIIFGRPALRLVPIRVRSDRTPH